MWKLLLLQGHEKTIAFFLRERFGEWLIRPALPLILGSLVLVAYLIRVVAVDWASEVWGSPDWARATDAWLRNGIPSGDIRPWIAFGLATTVAGYVHLAAIWKRRSHRDDAPRSSPGRSIFMRFSKANPDRDPVRAFRHWDLSQVVAEPAFGLLVSGIIALFDPALGFYISNLVLLLWRENVILAQRRREDRLALQDAMATQKYQERLLEVAKQWKGRRFGGRGGRYYRGAPRKRASWFGAKSKSKQGSRNGWS